MNDRSGHYVRATTRTIVPSSVFAVKLWPFYRAHIGQVGSQQMEWGAAEVVHVKRRKGHWLPMASAKFDKPEVMREWMDSRAYKLATNWVIAQSATDVLTLSQWWAYAEQRGIRICDRKRKGGSDGADSLTGSAVDLTCFIASGPPDIIDYRADGVRWRWVSATNYWPDGAGASSCHGGHDGVGACDWPTGPLPRDDDGRSGAVDLARRFVRLCDWWGTVATARIGPTAGAMAWGVLRSHIPTGALCSHKCEETHRLERACALGGRASVWYYGRIGARVSEHAGRDSGAGVLPGAHLSGPVHHLDVRSMYPALLRDEVYPVALGPVYGGIRTDALIDACRSGGVLARVRVQTLVPEYPRRTPKGIVYPVGQWTATLAGPELLALADTPGHGAILEVFQCATYRMGRPFADAMQCLIDARERASDPEDKTFAKLLANSVAGRLAMRVGGWRRWPALDAVQQWGEEWLGDADSATYSRYRWVSGVCHVHQPDREPRGPHTSAFAYLTAYGRVRMAHIRAACPVKSVYAQHTDGLYCSADAFRTLSDAGMIGGEGAGALVAKASADSARFFGPSHFRFGECWTLSGYHDAYVNEARGVIVDTQRTGLFAGRHSGAPTTVGITRRECAIPQTADGCAVGEDGWALPALAVPRKRAGGG